MSERKPRLRWRSANGHLSYWSAVHVGSGANRREIFVLETDGSDWRIDRAESRLDEPALAKARARTTRAAKLAAEAAALKLLKAAVAKLEGGA